MLETLEERGVLSPMEKPAGRLRPIARKPGSLARFLE